MSSKPVGFVTGVLLALDYGTKRLGAAVSDRDQNFASPVENYTRRTLELDAKFLRKIAVDYRVAGIVVGLPVHMSGDEGEKAKEARQFGAWVQSVTGLPVCYFDERYTSAQADELMRQAAVSPKKRKELRDKLSAQILLQSYLESSRLDAPQSLRDDEVLNLGD